MPYESHSFSSPVVGGQAVSQSGPAILQILPRLDTGGVERGTVEIAEAIRDAGGLPIVISAGGQMVRELERLDVVHIQLPVHTKNPFKIWKNIKAIEKVIRQFDVKLVHARSRAPAWSARAAAKNCGVPFITTFHGTYNRGPLGIKTPYNAVMASGQKVIAISHFIERHVQEHYGTPIEKITVIPRGVDIDKFNTAAVSAERMIKLATEWRLPEDVPVIMLPGRLTRWKGQHVVIDALSKMENKNVRCLLVGSDQGRTKYRQSLEAAIEKKGLQGLVHIVNGCSDMAAAYLLSDFVVSASTDPEAFGRVVVEAQAMGRPVIASRHGGPLETVTPGETGWLFAPGDSLDLAQTIEAALQTTQEERDRMAAACIKQATEVYSRSNMCQKTLELYRSVLQESGATLPVESS